MLPRRHLGHVKRGPRAAGDRPGQWAGPRVNPITCCARAAGEAPPPGTINTATIRFPYSNEFLAHSNIAALWANTLTGRSDVPAWLIGDRWMFQKIELMESGSTDRFQSWNAESLPCSLHIANTALEHPGRRNPMMLCLLPQGTPPPTQSSRHSP